MTFWTEGTAEPVRSYRFQIRQVGGEDPKDYWYAKSIDKPSFEVNTGTYQVSNHKFKFPGVLTWNDITMEIVDVGGKAKETLEEAFSFGYSKPDSGVKREGYSKHSNGEHFTMGIDQLDAAGKPIESWLLHGAFIKSVDFGTLAYADDDIVKISIGISYDYAILS